MNTLEYYQKMLKDAKRKLQAARKKYNTFVEPRFASSAKDELRAEIDRWEREAIKWSDRVLYLRRKEK